MRKPRAILAFGADGDVRARKQRMSRTTFRRLAAALTALALGAGLALVGVAAPASAHSANVMGNAVCQADGTYTITWKVQTSNVPSYTEGEVKVIHPVNEWLFEWTEHHANHGLPALKPNASFTWVQTGVDGNAEQASATFQIDWKDGYSHDPSKVITLAGDCAKPGTTIDLPAQPAIEDLCGIANDRIVPPVQTEGITWTISPVVDGKATATATALDGYEFPLGKTSKTWTFEFEDDLCLITGLVPPTPVDQCETDGDRIELPAIDHVTWQLVGDPTKGETVTVSAKADEGYAFPQHATTTWTFDFTDEPCPPTIVPLVGEPTQVDRCGIDLDAVVLPEPAEYVSWVVDGDPKLGGIVTVTAVPADGYAFADDVTTVFEFTFDSTPCPTEIPVPVKPGLIDLCGAEGDGIVAPAAIEGIEWAISPVVDGAATATATAKPGYVFPGGESSATWAFEFVSEPCIEPSLAGSVVSGVCLADAPWISYEILLTDPDNQSDADGAVLVFTDGVNTETVPLGSLDENRALEGKVLWPGASVADDGVTPTGWPGWVQVDGKWVETDDNFGWTLASTTATLVVNPDVEVAIAYPPATPDCAAAPPQDDIPGDEAGSPSGVGLASTGFAVTTIVIVAGMILVAGLAFLVIARMRRARP